MIKLATLIKELIDLYRPEELASKGISHVIEEESSKRFTVLLSYKDEHYMIKVLPLYNVKRPSINFGNTNSDYENLNLNKLINSPYSSRILATVFGLIRYWVDKYNVQEFEYGAEGEVRNKLYSYYLKKYFSDFQNFQESFGENIIQVWKKL